jgi:hypothetical protein
MIIFGAIFDGLIPARFMAGSCGPVVGWERNYRFYEFPKSHARDPLCCALRVLYFYHRVEGETLNLNHHAVTLFATAQEARSA